MKKIPGLDSKALLEAISSENAPVSIRYNRSKMLPEPLPAQKVPWCSTGYYVQEVRKFITDPFWHAGAYYVQEASSMLLWAVLDGLYKSKPALVLDLCAAPGGKSTLISDWLNEKGVLVSNEIIPKRYSILEENMTRWGQGFNVLTNTKVETFSRNGIQFDLVVVDAPCSGEGLFRKDPKAIQEWTPDSNLKCSIRQKVILDNAWQALKPGGHIIYSTCTYNTLENEDVLNYMIEKFGAEIVTPELPDNWGFVKSELKTGHAYRAYPHLVKGEGFFTGVLQKPVNSLPHNITNRNNRASYRFFYPIAISGKKNAIPKEEKDLTKPFENWDFYQNRDTIFTFPSEWKDIFQILNDSVPVKWAGVPVMNVNRLQKQPHIGLALNYKSSGEFEKVEFSLEDALSYLRGQALPFSGGTKAGYLQVAFKGRPLGWVKNAGKRLNNLYPKAWRIKHY